MSPRSIRLGAAEARYKGNVDTRLFVLLGQPVSHSLSPRMHNAALRALRIEAAYVACELAPEALRAGMADLRRHAVAGRIAGANVTVPHKNAVIADVDALDDVARHAGAVNTICIEREPERPESVVLRGCNTDVGGLVAALGEVGVSLGGTRVVVLGAGGMGRAAVVAALREGAAAIRVCARDASRAQELLDELTASWRGRVPQLACATLADADELLEDAQVLLQATPLGLRAGDPSPISLAAARPALFVFDAVYRPSETALLRDARARGLRTANGLGMLVHQGAAAFALWTGAEPPLDVMRRSVQF